MKRQKNMFLLLFVLVLLIGAVFAVTALNKEEESETVIQDLNDVVFSVDSNAVTALSWNYSEEVSFHRTESGWEYAEDAVFPLDESQLSSALNILNSITASKVIENVEDWDQYGLEVPVCSVTVTADATYTLSFGAEASVSGGQYFSIGDGNAYIIDTNHMEPFSHGLYDLLVMECIPAMDSVTALKIKNSSGTVNISREENSGKSYSDHYVWFQGDNALDTELTDALVTTLSSVSWNKCSNYQAKDLSVYGLDTPAATVTVNYTAEDGTAETFTLEIGNASGDDHFAKLADSAMVYLIDGAIGESLLNASRETLMPDDVLAMDWNALQTMEITLDGTVYEVVQESPAEIDAEGNVAQAASYTMNGAAADASGIVDALDVMVSTGYATDVLPERNEEIRILFHQEHSAYPEVELVFYQYSGEACLVTLNGESTVFVARAQVVDLVESVTQLVLG